jgi:hypothetical protein
VINSARDRVKRYKKGNRPHAQYLAACLDTCLDWFPRDAPYSLAKDILNAGNDQELWEVFHNVLTGVLYPSKDKSDLKREITEYLIHTDLI